MDPKLQIDTKHKQENNDEAGEPVSPSGQYFNSKALCFSTLAVFELEVPFDDSLAMSLLQDIFLPINPRFSSIMVYKKGGRYWKRVEVNLEDHCYIPRFPEGVSDVKWGDKYIDEYLTKLSMETFREDKPLWEVHIVNYPTSKAAAQLIFKLHQALGDGYTLMGVLLSRMQRAHNPSIPLTFPSIKVRSEVESNNYSALRWVPRTLSFIGGTFDFAWSFLKTTWIPDDNTPIRSGNHGLGRSHPLEISNVEFSLDQIKLIKTKLGTTVNDTIGGIIFMGIRLYMQETDTKFGKSRATAVMPLNLRHIRDYKPIEEMLKSQAPVWGNHLGTLHVDLPTINNGKCSNPLDFIYDTQKQVKRYRFSPSVYLDAQYLEFMRKFKGAEVVAEHLHAIFHNSSVVLTNMIGPIEKMALADHPVKGIYFMAVGCPHSLVITIMSYMQTLRIGVGVEKGFIDSQMLISCIKNAFELTYEAAMKCK